MNHLPSLNAFNLSKDFIFFRLFLFFFSSSVQRKFLKKKKKERKTIELHFGKLMDIFFYQKNLFTKNLSSSISRRKKEEAPFSLERRESHLSRVWRYRDVWKKLFTFALPSISYRRRKNLRYCSKWSSALERKLHGWFRSARILASLSLARKFLSRGKQERKRQKRRLLDSKQTPLPPPPRWSAFANSWNSLHEAIKARILNSLKKKQEKKERRKNQAYSF